MRPIAANRCGPCTVKAFATLQLNQEDATRTGEHVDASVTDRSTYELVLTPPAVRAICSGLPGALAAAVIEFLAVDRHTEGLACGAGQELRGRVAFPGNPNSVRTPGLNAT